MADDNQNQNPPDKAGPPKAAAAGYKPGKVVHYRHPDPITGQDRTGFGLVLRGSGSEGASVAIAPVAVDLPLEVDPANLSDVELPEA